MPSPVDIDLASPRAADMIGAAMLSPLDAEARRGMLATGAAFTLGLLEAGEAERFLEEVFREVVRARGGDPACVRISPSLSAALAPAVQVVRDGAVRWIDEARASFSPAAVARAQASAEFTRERREQFEGAPRNAAFVVARMIRVGDRASQNKACQQVEGETGVPASTLGKLWRPNPAKPEQARLIRAKTPLWTAGVLAIELMTRRTCAPADFFYRLIDLIGTYEGRARIFALEPAVRDFCEKHQALRSLFNPLLAPGEAVEYRTGVPREALPDPADFPLL